MPQCHSCHVNLMPQHATVIGGRAYCEDCAADEFLTCGSCHCHTRRDAARLVRGVYYCPACYSNLVRCDRCGQRHAATQNLDDQSLCHVCYEHLAVTCENCGEICNRHFVRSTPNEEIWCENCFHEACTVCDSCENSIWNDDVQEISGRVYCRRCARDRCREWDSKPFVCDTPTYDIIGSTRKFGVELETSECPHHTEVRDTTIWECKSDCSIEGLEFVSPVLYGDQGLADIENLCMIARRKGWMTNRYCGYHAHFDVTGEDWESLKRIAYAYRLTYELWCCFVSDARSSNPMCGAPDYSCADIRRINSAEDWEYFAGVRDRFEWVNWRAYLAHGTMEVRSHDASLNAHEICNWVKAHARFMDFAKEWDLSDLDALFSGDISEKFEAIVGVLGVDLADFYANRARAHGKPVRPSQTPERRATRPRRATADF